MSDPNRPATPPAPPNPLPPPETPSDFWSPDLVENRQIARALADNSVYLQRAIETSSNPQETLDRINSSLFLAYRMGLDLPYVIENHDAVSRNYWGEMIPPKSEWKAIRDAYQSALLDQKIAMAGWEQLTGNKSPELEEQIKNWEMQLPSPDNQARQWHVEFAKAMAGFAPLQIEMKKFSVPLGAAQAGLAAMIGAGTGPAIPALVVSNFIMGMSLGDKAYLLASEAGRTYRGLLRLGVPDEVARPIGVAIGAGRAALMTGALHNIPGFAKVFRGMDFENLFARNLTSELVNKGRLAKFINGLVDKAATPAGKGVAAFATEYGLKGQVLVPAMMTGAEFLAVLGEAGAKAWSNATRKTNLAPAQSQEIWSRLWETWKSMAIADLGMALPGALKAGVQRAGRAAAAEGERRRAEREAQTPVEPEPVKITEEGPAAAAAEGLQTSAKGGQPLEAPKEEPALGAVIAEEPGVIQGEIRSEDETQTWGRIGYLSGSRSLDIMNLQIAPGQEGHVRDALVGLMRENAGKDIRWNPMDSAGIALRDQLLQDNPRRAELQGAIDELARTRTEQEGNLRRAGDEPARAAIAADMGRLETEIRRLEGQMERVGLQWFTEAPLDETAKIQDLVRTPEAAPEEPWRLSRGQYAEQAKTQPAEERDAAFLQDPARSFLSQAFPGWTRAEVDVAASIMDTRAEALRISTQDFLEKYFAPGLFKRWQGQYLPPEVFAKLEPDAFVLNQAKKAATQFMLDGRALLHLSESADFVSFIHEIAHVFRRQLADEEAAVAAQWAGVPQVEGQWRWTREAEEKWSQGFEEYVREGVAPTPQLEGLFQRMAEWLKRIYQVLAARVEISPDIRRVYDRLFMNEETVRPQEAEPAILFQPGESAETPSSRLNRLVQSPPVVIQTSPEWQQVDLAELRRLVRPEYKALPDVTNAETGRTISFVFTGFREIKRHSADRRILLLVPGLAKIAETAIPIYSEPDRGGNPQIPAWRTYVAKAVLEGAELYVRLSTWEEKGKLYIDFFHDASVTEAEKVTSLSRTADLIPNQGPPEAGSATPSQSAYPLPRQGQTETSFAKDKLLRWIAAVKRGELSDTTAAQARALDTATFRDWFAGSQAVDQQGRPRTFYHGTYAEFSTFERTRDLGYHFGTSEHAATRMGGEDARAGARVIPVYLSIKNPLRLSQDIFSRFEDLPMERAAEILAKEAALPEDQAAGLRELAGKVSQLRSELGPADARYQDAREAFWDQAKADLKAQGYDGVVYPNQVEGVGESWIAFEANQVKSVFNRGTWGESPNILFHEAPEEELAAEGRPIDEKAAADHEAATREAVEAGEAVPEEVLKEYESRDWAKAEISRRAQLIRNAKDLDTFNEFRQYGDAMSPPTDPVHATEYWSMIWDQAKSEQTVGRQAANKAFLERFEGEEGRKALAGVLEDAAHKEKLEGLHPVMQAVAKRLRKGVAIGKGVSDEAYVKIMAQIRDDPARYRALFAEIEGNEEAIRQLIAEERVPQKETLEERLRRENRELRQKSKRSEATAAVAARELRLEKSYSADLERKITKLQAAHEEKVASMKLEASQKQKEKAAQATERGRERIAALRDRQAASRAQQRVNRKVREAFNKKIRELQKIQREIPYMHPDAKGPLTDLLDEVLLKRTSSKRKLRLQEIRDFFEKNPEVEVSDSLKETLAELDKKSVREMTVEEFDNLYNAVNHYATLNRDIQATRIAGEWKRREDVKEQALKELRHARPLEGDEFSEEAGPRQTERVGGGGRVGRAIRKGYDTILGMGQDHYNLIVERIAGPLSIVHRLFVRQIEEGRRVQLQYKEQVHRQFRRDIAALGVNNITSWLAEITPIDRFELTRGERMALWMHAQNPDNLSSLLHAGFGLRRREGDRRFHFNDEKELGILLESVSEQEKIFCTAAQRLFEAQGKALAKIFLEKNGYELPTVEAYYPKDVMPIGRGSEAAKEDALERFKGRFMRIGIAKGMIKERKGVDVPLYLNNIAFDVERSIDRAAAYVGFEIPLTQASRLLYDRDFREQLSLRYGPRVWTEIEKGLRDVAGEFQQLDSLEKNLLQFRTGLTMAFLGFNPWSVLKQPLSLGNALAYVPARYLVQGLAETIGHGGEIFAMHRANSPYFNARLEMGFVRDIADATRVHAERSLYGARTTAQRWAFLGIKGFDAFTVASVMRGAWLQAMEELGGGRVSRDLLTVLDLKDRSITNLSLEERNALAYRYTDFVLTRTQDQALPEYRSPLSRSKWGKFFTMFGSSSNTALNVLRRSLLDMKQGGDPAAVRRLAMTILAVGVMGPAGEASVNLLRSTLRAKLSQQPQDDQEKLKAFIANYINSAGGMVYFVRDATNRAINSWQYGAFGTSTDTANPVGFLMDTVQSMIAVGVSAMTEDDFLERRRKWTRFIDQFALTTSLLSQMPLYMPTKALTRAFGEPAKPRKRR